MLNKECLSAGKGEVLGKVTIKLDIQGSILEPDVFTVYKFTGSNFSVGPEDVIYAQFRHGEEGIQKTVDIPIGTVVYIRAKMFTIYWGSGIEGFEYVEIPAMMSAYKLVSDTGTLVISGHYD